MIRTYILLWVVKSYYSELGISQEDVLKVHYALERYLKTRGPVWTAEQAKLARLAVTKFVAGEILELPAGISLTKDRLPRILPDSIRSLIRLKSPRAVSLALTLLSETRVLLGGKPVDYTPITDPFKGKIPSDVLDFIPKFVRWLGSPTVDTNWTEFHWSTKAGPNGPALISSLRDLESLPKDLKKDLCIIGGPELDDAVYIIDSWATTTIRDFLNEVFKANRKGMFRKLSIKDDRETKSRIFGILDYWSQTSLMNLHKGLFGILKTLKRDFTFNQDDGLNLKSTPGSSYHSIDLKNATDRFPVLLQQYLLSELIEPEKAAAWSRIMTKYEFKTPTGESVLYGAGQPIGAHSSWPIFALTHHLVVQSAANRVNKFPFSAYSLLGDDIVIADDLVALEYKSILKTLDCPISTTKTHTSKDVFEFAKRWKMGSEEMSPFPIHGLQEVINKYHLLYELLTQVEKRGFSLQWIRGEPVGLRQLLSNYGLKGRLLDSTIRNFRALDLLPKNSVMDKEEAGVNAKLIADLFNIQLSCNVGSLQALDILTTIASASLRWHNSRLAEKCHDLVSSWTNEVQEILSDPDTKLGPGDQPELLSMWPRLVPPLAVLLNKATESLESIGPDAEVDRDKYRVWDKFSHQKLLIIPEARGVNPTRNSHLYSGARAAQVKNIVTTWKRHLEGKRPGIL
jgi:hypothetical protein